jgi:3-hydroxyisobutyrate dehydrogenase-like beta-hydroxyacid dehydrogenase
MASTKSVLPAEKSGIPRATPVDMLLNTIAASPMLQYRGSFVLKMPDEAWFNVNMMQKDMLHPLEPGRQVEILTPARAMGLAERDLAIIFQVLERMSGVSK